MKKIGLETLYILLISLLVSFFAVIFYSPAANLFSQPDFSSEENTLDLEMAKKILMRENAIWIDARPEEFYNQGHLPGAINIPLPGPVTYRRELFDQWEKDKLIVTYCSSFSCPIARHLTAEMKFYGFTNVFVYAGGYADWIENGLPVDKKMEESK